MSSKHYRLLLSTCVSVATLASVAPVYAGFEWTPPEEQIQEVTPEVIESEPVLDTPIVETPVVEQTPLDEAPMVEISPEPIVEDVQLDPEPAIIDIEVMEQAKEIEEEPVIEEVPVDIIDDQADVIVEEVIVEVEDAAELETDMVVRDIDAAPSETPVNDDGSVTLNLFPDANDVAADDAQAVVLPSDTSKKIDDLNADDVGASVAVEEAVEAPKEEIIWNTPETFDVIEGFGNEMPLVLALSQIVPPQYAYSFGNGVQQGAVVSWEGGKPWNEVLGDTLQTVGLVYEIKSNKVVITASPVAEKAEVVSVEASEVVIEEEAAVEEPVSIEPNGKEDVLKAVIKAEEKYRGVSEEDEGAAVDELQHNQLKSIETPVEEISAEELKKEAEAQVEEPVNEVERPEFVEIVKDPLREEALSDVENTDLPRKAILDPGPVESVQPETDNATSGANFVSDQKKNIASTDVSESVEEQVIIKAPEPIDAADVADSLNEMSEEEVLAVLEEKPVELSMDEPAEILEIEVPEVAAEEPMPLETVEIEPVVEPETVPLKEVVEEVVEEAPKVATTKVDEPIEPQHSYRLKPSNKVVVWEAKRGKSLYDVVEKWCEEENVRLVWNGSKDYELSSNIYINGTFQNAVEVLFAKGVKRGPEFLISTDGSYEIRVSDDG